MTPSFILKPQFQTDETNCENIQELSLQKPITKIMNGGNRSNLRTVKKKNMYNQNLKIDELLEKQFKNYNIQYFK